MEHGSSTTMLQDKTVALTGRLASMTHREARELVDELGGRVVQAPTRETDFLVVGSDGLPLGDDGQPTANLLTARKLHSLGYAIEIIAEESFLRRLELLDDEQKVHRRYTIVQLSRILDVPRDRVRAWMRAGLIEPVETIHRLVYFDYQQVTAAKNLCDLVNSGLTPARIRDSLVRVTRWLPDSERLLSQLSVLESSQQLFVRLDDGRLADPSGQTMLPFDSDDDHPVALRSDEKSVEQWFDEAISLEDAGFFQQASAAYRAAVQQAPDDPVLHFNLGNVLYSLNDREGACSNFRRAVELESSYVEAWNNLGNLMAELGQLEQATTALRYALHLVPTYADAHFNLASILAGAGRNSEAVEHWRSYLDLDPLSPWADEAKKHLAGATV
jgi:tetratricopeptide (TPR) repeat protein